MLWTMVLQVQEQHGRGLITTKVNIHFLQVLVPKRKVLGGFIGFHDSLGLEMPHSISLLGDSTMLFLDWEAFSYLEVTGITPGWHTILVTFDLDNLSSEFIVDGVSAGIMSTSFGVTSGFGV